MDWKRVETCFGDALEQPVTERVRFLEEACADDEAVRDEVLRLLGHFDNAGDFLEMPLLLVAAAEEVLEEHLNGPRSELGEMVGPYRLREVIGEGGMGAVFLASREDDAFEQDVAIKRISRGLADGEAVERFRNERQILARLDHPNIGRLYDGGTSEDGRPYLVMEYVHGRRIDDYCDAEGLGLEDRLRLFLKVCAAVGYAHRSLLIHRDLKPSNILVTEDGVPKLLDFGIAKSLEQDTARTLPGQLPMTPAYASPEQIRGDPGITTASDVYGLGVVLYELVTGSTPYLLEDGRAYTLQQAILQQEPRPPSQVANAPEMQQRLRGDVDAILLKALRKEPELRYESVEAFVGDLERFLEDLPVEARGDALSYRVRKFVRRHRMGIAAVLVAALVLAGFIAALIRQTRLATEERDNARAQTEIAEQRKVVAERLKQRAERTATAFKEAFKVSDPEIARGADITAREILDGAAGKLRKNLKDEPEILAELLTTMGEVYVSLGEFEEAEGVLMEAHGLRQGTEMEGLSHYQLGELEWHRREYVAAEGHYRQALSFLEEGTVEHARALRGLGLALVRQGRGTEAEKHLEEALQRLRERFDSTDTEVARCIFGLGWAARDRGDYDRAEELFRQVVEVRRQQPAGPALGRALAELGLVRFRQGAFKEARALLEEALLLVALAGETTYLAEVLGKLSVVLISLGEDLEAEVLIRRILELAPEGHPARGKTLHNLALIHHRRGEYTRAIDALQEALAANRRVFGMKNLAVAVNLCLLGRLSLDRSLHKEALDYFEECVAISSSIEPGHLQLAFAWIGLGRINETKDGCSAALPWYRKAYELRKGTLGEEHIQTAEAAVLLASCLENKGDAKALLRPSLKTLEQELDESDERVIEARQRLEKLEG